MECTSCDRVPIFMSGTDEEVDPVARVEDHKIENPLLSNTQIPVQRRSSPRKKRESLKRGNLPPPHNVRGSDGNPPRSQRGNLRKDSSGHGEGGRVLGVGSDRESDAASSPRRLPLCLRFVPPYTLFLRKPIFRAPSTVDACSFHVEADRLVFVLQGRQGAVYSRDQCPGGIVGPPRLFLDLLAQFPSSTEEITVTPSVDTFRVMNSSEDPTSTRIQTHLRVEPTSFSTYTCPTPPPGDITFCVKEMKALLSFCEASGQAISFHFERGGRPVVFSTSLGDEASCDLVLATLIDESGTPVAPGSEPPTVPPFREEGDNDDNDDDNDDDNNNNNNNNNEEEGEDYVDCTPLPSKRPRRSV